MSNMKLELKKILDENSREIQRYTNIKDGLMNKIKFCSDHKFDEEVRRARIEYEAMDMLLYQYKSMHEELNELLQSEPAAQESDTTNDK